MGSSPVARRYWGNHFCFLFLRVLRCFSSPGSPPPLGRMAVRQTAGLPHSGTPGSMTACVSPGLFAACRALHRLPEPQASAVRPFLLSAQPPRTWRGGRIPSERRITPQRTATTRNMRTGQCGGRRPSLVSLFCSIMSMSKSLNEGCVENIGIEPMTSCMPCKRSSQLS